MIAKVEAQSKAIPGPGFDPGAEIEIEFARGGQDGGQAQEVLSSGELGAPAFNDSGAQPCAVPYSGTSSVITLNSRKFAVPNDVVSATSDASRPTAINTRPMRG